MSKTKNNVGVNPINIVANSAAAILRQVVSSVFKVPANSVRLSGEIDPQWMGSNTTGISYMSHSETGDFGIWGFNPKTGIKQISGVISNTHMYHGNHDQNYTHAERLCDVKGIEEYVFFIVLSGDDSDLPYSQNYTIFKAPNFKEYFDKVTTEDITRWENWIQA